MPFVTAALALVTRCALPVFTQATQWKAPAYVSQPVLIMPPTSTKKARPANSAIHSAPPALQLAALLVTGVCEELKGDGLLLSQNDECDDGTPPMEMAAAANASLRRDSSVKGALLPLWMCATKSAN